jgi:hypothetical protein
MSCRATALSRFFLAALRFMRLVVCGSFIAATRRKESSQNLFQNALKQGGACACA